MRPALEKGVPAKIRLRVRDLSADSVKSVVYTRDKLLKLEHRVPKLQSFEYHICAYLGFEISVFISVL